MAHKQKFDYFDAFVKISTYGVQSSDKIVSFFLEHFDETTKTGSITSKETLRFLEELHELEDASDDVVHELLRNLSNEFVTPIDREDIVYLSNALDDIVDELDDVVQRLYMYHVNTIVPELVEMAQVVHEATCAVQKACEKFTHFKKSRSIHEYIVQINDCEDRGDRVYIRSVHRIYGRSQDGAFDGPLDAYGFSQVLSSLERCCDACEDVGDTIATVMIKNS